MSTRNHEIQYDQSRLFIKAKFLILRMFLCDRDCCYYSMGVANIISIIMFRYINIPQLFRQMFQFNNSQRLVVQYIGTMYVCTRITI